MKTNLYAIKSELLADFRNNEEFMAQPESDAIIHEADRLLKDFIVRVLRSDIKMAKEIEKAERKSKQEAKHKIILVHECSRRIDN